MPVSIRDRSRRLLLIHSRRRICSLERSRNSARVAASTSPSRWRSVNVRSAAIGVRSSWLTSAMNSRSRSRSARITDSVRSSWSAMALNWLPSASTSAISAGSTRSARLPSAMRADASCRRARGRVSRLAAHAPTRSATTKATTPPAMSANPTRSTVSTREVYGLLISTRTVVASSGTGSAMSASTACAATCRSGFSPSASSPVGSSGSARAITAPCSEISTVAWTKLASRCATGL